MTPENGGSCVSIPMRLPCPSCGELHVDEGEFATKEHHTHACQECGHVWRPAVVPTVGVRFLPGFLNGEAPAEPFRGAALREHLEAIGMELVNWSPAACRKRAADGSGDGAVWMPRA